VLQIALPPVTVIDYPAAAVTSGGSRLLPPSAEAAALHSCFSADTLQLNRAAAKSCSGSTLCETPHLIAVFLNRNTPLSRPSRSHLYFSLIPACASSFEVVMFRIETGGTKGYSEKGLSKPYHRHHPVYLFPAPSFSPTSSSLLSPATLPRSQKNRDLLKKDKKRKKRKNAEFQHSFSVTLCTLGLRLFLSCCK
jgi:hypothetical protein